MKQLRRLKAREMPARKRRLENAVAINVPAARSIAGERRLVEPEDIANAVVFLASPESGWITAQILTVDGGRMDYIGHA
jgi:NAD(P)-dependent dehydrogenase (short-subunit alcohol dehydrogenase family)